MLLRLLFLASLISASTLSAADLYWNPPSSTATDGNVAANWTIGDIPGPAATSIDVTDRLFFDGTGSFNDNDCTFSSSLVVAGLSSSISSYNGIISDGGNTISVDFGDVSLLSGTLALTGSLFITAPPTGTSTLAISPGQVLHTVAISITAVTSTLNLASNISIANVLTVTGAGQMNWTVPTHTLTLQGPFATSSFDATMTFAGLASGSTIISQPASGTHTINLPSGTPIPGLHVKGSTTLGASSGSGTLTMNTLCTLTADPSTTLTIASGTTLGFTDTHPVPTFGSASTIDGAGTVAWDSTGGAFWAPSGVSIQCPMVFTGDNSAYAIPGGWTFGPVTIQSTAAKILTVNLLGQLAASSISLQSPGASNLTIRFSSTGAELRSTGDITDTADPSSNLSLVANGAPVILDATGTVTLDDSTNSWGITSDVDGLVVRAGTGVDLSGITSFGSGTLTLVNSGTTALSPLSVSNTWDVVLKGDGAQIHTSALTINSITSSNGAQAIVVADSSNAIAFIDLSASKLGTPNIIRVLASSTFVPITKPIVTGGDIEELPITTSAILGSASNPTQLQLDLSGTTPPDGTRFEGVVTLPASVVLAPDVLTNVEFVGTGTGNGTSSWDVANHEIDVVVASSGTPASGYGTPFTPKLIRSTGRDTIFNAVCPGTAEGLARLKASLAGSDPTQIIAFTWDATAQQFLRYPVEPTGGVQPWHAWFIATRVALALNFNGTPVDPGNVPLEKKWNFIGYPPVTSNDLSATYYDHLLAEIDLDQDGSIITGTARDAVITGQLFLWNGSAYSAKTVFKSGLGYWIYNEANPVGGTVESLTRTVADAIIVGKPRAAAASSTTSVHTNPPPPPGQQAQSESSGGGCGGGSAAALLLMLGVLVGLGFSRAKRR